MAGFVPGSFCNCLRYRSFRNSHRRLVFLRRKLNLFRIVEPFGVLNTVQLCISLSLNLNLSFIGTFDQSVIYSIIF